MKIPPDQIYESVRKSIIASASRPERGKSADLLAGRRFPWLILLRRQCITIRYAERVLFNMDMTLF